MQQKYTAYLNTIGDVDKTYCTFLHTRVCIHAHTHTHKIHTHKQLTHIRTLFSSTLTLDRYKMYVHISMVQT